MSQKDRYFKPELITSSSSEIETAEAQLRLQELVTGINLASARIRNSLQGVSTLYEYLEVLSLPINPYSYHRFLARDGHELLWMTSPEMTNPLKEDGLIYHTTGNQGASLIIEGGNLTPPFTHETQGLTSHKGAAIRASYEILRYFGVPIPLAEFFLFCHHNQIDPNPIRHVLDQSHLTIAEYNQNLKQLFLCTHPDGYSMPHPTISQAAEILKRGGKPKDDPQIKDYINDWLWQFYKQTNIRAFWFELLKDIMLGKEPASPDALLKDPYDDCNDLGGRLEDIFKSFASTPSNQPIGEPAILIIDPEIIYQLNSVKGCMLMPFSPRAIGKISSFMVIPSEAVIGIASLGKETPIIEKNSYYEGRLELPGYQDIPWISGIDYRSPEADNNHPEATICKLLYDSGTTATSPPDKTILDLLAAGHIAPTIRKQQHMFGTNPMPCEDPLLTKLIDMISNTVTYGALRKLSNYQVNQALGMGELAINPVFDRIGKNI